MKKRVLSSILSFVLMLSLFSGMRLRDVNAQTAEARLKIMSFNVLTTSTQPIEAAYQGKTRGEMLIEMIDQYQPNSMGLNEVTQKWKDYLDSNVTPHAYAGGAKYSLTGTKADDSTTTLMSGSNEYSPILYRSDLYEVEETGGYWFSATPNVKSKYTDILDSNGNLLYKGMAYDRVMSYAVFKYKGTNEIAYIHINSHFDHKSADYINILCSKQVKKKADELALKYQRPVVLSGDMNATEEAGAYKYLANGKNGYLNAKYVTDHYSLLPSCAGYGTGYDEKAYTVIDHIFISAGNIGVYKHDILKKPYISDHSAVYVELSLDQMPKLDNILVNNKSIQGFSGNKFSYDAYLSENSLSLEFGYNTGYTVTSSVYNGATPTSGTVSNGHGILNFSLSQGDNRIFLYVKDPAGRCTTYTLNIYKEYGEAKPVISEIYPNAIPGYKYFEVTNTGTSSMSTDDYAFLWGSIKRDAAVSWEGVLELSGNREIRPGETVVFWFTYGGSFTPEPTAADFNAHYKTDLAEDNIIIFRTSDKFRCYDGSLKEITTFTMGGNPTRGMRIASAKDSNGTPYGWTKKSTNAVFNGPTISVSSYNGILPADLAQNQLFKFKYVEGQNIAAASDVLDVFYASPGKYDTRLGNEPKDAYTRIEAGQFDTFGGLMAEGDNIGGTIARSWAFYSNVVFGDIGAGTAVFSAAAKESNASGIIDIYIDGKSDGSLTNATKIGTLRITPTGPDWINFEDFEYDFSQLVIGTHNVTLVFTPDIGKTYVANLDYFIFKPYVQKPDLKEVSSIAFKLDGEPLTTDTQLDASLTKNTYTLSAEATYLPMDASFSIEWASSNPDIAKINAKSGVITVLSYGDFSVQAAVYSNKQRFKTFTTPILSTNYKISAFDKIEVEWASSFTAGTTKIPSAKKATGVTGISDNFTNDKNYVGDTGDKGGLTIKSVDFGNEGISKFIMNAALRSSNSGGTVTVYADSVDEANKIGYCITSVPSDAPDTWVTYLLFEGIIEKSVTGIHDIILSFSTVKTYIGNIDYMIFEKPDTTPPTWNSGSVTASNVTQNGVTLSWSGASDNASTVAYAVYKNGSLLTTVTDNVYNVIGLTSDTTYIFKIEAGDAAGNWTSDGPSITQTTLSIPEVPDTTPPTWNSGKVTASNVTQTSLTLSWSGASDNVGTVAYAVYKNGSLLTTLGSVTTYGVTGLTANTTYTFKIEAVDTTGNWSTTGPTITVTSLSSSGDGYGGSRTTFPVQPDVTQPKVDTDTGKAIVVAKATLDTTTATAKAEVKAETITKALEQAKAASKGVKTLSIEIPKVEGAKAYETVLPAIALTQTVTTQKVEIKTDVAKLEVPGNMLNTTEMPVLAANVALTIAAVDKSMLSTEAKAVIGDRPVIELNVKVDDKVTYWSNPDAPVKVSIPYKPTEQELKNPEHIVVYYIDGAGKSIPVLNGKYDPRSGGVTFTTTHFSNYAVSYVEKSFEDIASVAWAKKEIEVLTSKGIINGTSDTTFTPSASITRADFLLLLVKTLGLTAKVENNFSDVSTTDYYYEALGIAKKLGVSQGRGNNLFDPNAEISRQEMMTLTARAMRLANKLNTTGSSVDLEGYSDKSDVSGYAVESIASLVKNGVVQGDGRTLNPTGNATRAEAAVMMYRIYNK